MKTHFIDPHGAPPRIKFPFQIFKDYTISCSKGFTQIKYSYVVHSFTHWVDQYSQVKSIIKRLRTANRSFTHEINLNQIELSIRKYEPRRSKKNIISD